MTSTDHHVRLRRAVLDDAAALTSLNEHVQRLHVDAALDHFAAVDPAAAQAFFTAQLAEDSTIVWIAELDGRAVGYLYAVRAHRAANPFTTEQHTLYIHHLAVDPAVRRRGVGSAMFTAAAEHARVTGLAGLRLDSWLFNEAAHAFFLSQGFEPVLTHFARGI